MNQANDCDKGGLAMPIGVSDFSTSEPILNAEKIIACGFDFIEPGLAKIAAMTQADFNAAAIRIKQCNIHVRSVNWFLPSDLKVTGPEADDSKSRNYLEHALMRAAVLGAGTVVFGSPNSRSIPIGFPKLQAREQMIGFCRLCSDVIRENNWPIKIALEHVNHTETNFINTFAQALSVAIEVDREEVGLAADFYHFAVENESMDVIGDVAGLVYAVQLANPDHRSFPKLGVEVPGLGEFFRVLFDIGYTGGVSVEANVSDLEMDFRNAALCLRKFMDDCHPSDSQ